MHRARLCLQLQAWREDPCWAGCFQAISGSQRPLITSPSQWPHWPCTVSCTGVECGPAMNQGV